ncbi:FAD synthase-like isoform X2 [Centruroides sculpturatus]|uniref:FAD synthase-like isoform X2 n=2 Tax=Centruroides sculpturatus TaxID=218467 RepID=UPI000C6D4C64|nr:FAD synthase-like isoform X2 [Centruroides sculpturatus]
MIQLQQRIFPLILFHRIYQPHFVAKHHILKINLYQHYNIRNKVNNLTYFNMAERPTASIITVGDEILKGQTTDTNSIFLCKQLYDLGVKVQRVVVIPDEVNVIAEEVLSCSKTFTFVLTSGGIGPTHDDLTYEGVAKAFKEPLVENKILLEILQKWCEKLQLDGNSIRKMSLLPKSAVLHYPKIQTNSKKFFFPIVSVYNVYIFPGIPTYLEYSFNLLKDIFTPVTPKKFHSKILCLRISEFEFIDNLNQAVKKFQNEVQFGSYPIVDNTNYKVKITLESENESSLIKAEAYLRSLLPPNSVVNCKDPSLSESIQEVYNLLESHCQLPSICSSNLSERVAQSITVLEECLQQYPEECIGISFNGGKDCTVLLHLAYCVLSKNSKKKPSLKAFYFRSSDPFPEIEEFIRLSVERYQLNLLTYKTPIKNSLWKLLEENPEIKVILMGTRYSDPHSDNIKPFQKTDPGWPQFMRVNPLLSWDYEDIWSFLRLLDVPYCSLYDNGYSSLGNRQNTHPNPLLEEILPDGTSIYKPAYLLHDPKEERKGRF